MRHLAFLMLLAGAAAAADLSGELAGWPDGPAGIVMTPAEREQWATVASDDGARRFIALFWARRDPDLGTRANEYRADFEARVAAADRQFAEEGRRGALTDRGRALVLLGVPARRATASIEAYVESVYHDKPSGGSHSALTQDFELDGATMVGAQSVQTMDYSRIVARDAKFQDGMSGDADTIRHGVRFDLELGRADVWEYEVGSAETGTSRVSLPFFDHRGTGRYLLETGLDRVQGGAELMAGSAAATVVNPGLADLSPTAIADGYPPASEEQLRWLQERPGQWPDAARAVAMRSVGPDGGRPLWLFLDLGPEAGQAQSLAARLLDRDSEPLGSLQVAAPGRVVELALPGTDSAATLELGLAGPTGPLGTRSLAVEPAEPGAFITRVQAGSTVTEVGAAGAGAPFVYGGFHLSPSPGHRYSPADTLSYFSLIARPDGGEPDEVLLALRLFQVRAAVEQLVAASERRLTPSPVAPGVLMLGSQMPLSGLPGAGSFRLEITVEDPATGARRTTSLPFQMATPP